MIDQAAINTAAWGPPEKTRNAFSGVLRGLGMVKYDAHQVAHRPGRQWFIMRCSDGYLRAEESSKAARYRARRIARAGIAVIEVFGIRWKREPLP